MLPLIGGVFALSTAAVAIRLVAPEMPALGIATWRMMLSTMLFLWVLPRASWVRRYLREVLLAGIFLGLHFTFWISSLFYTTVASSVVLVTTTPLFTALVEWIRGDLPRPVRTFLAMGMVLAGMVFLGGGDWALREGALLGDALALLGAVCGAGYLITGRRVRKEVPATLYVGPVYGVAALLLLLISVLSGTSLALPSPRAAAGVLWLALVPQGLGHTLINWGLGHTTATGVSLLILGEPLLSTLWAWWILHEVPPGISLFGMALILLGLTLHMAGERRNTPHPA